MFRIDGQMLIFSRCWVGWLMSNRVECALGVAFTLNQNHNVYTTHTHSLFSLWELVCVFQHYVTSQKHCRHFCPPLSVNEKLEPDAIWTNALGNYKRIDESYMNIEWFSFRFFFSSIFSHVVRSIRFHFISIWFRYNFHNCLSVWNVREYIWGKKLHIMVAWPLAYG